MVEVWGIDKLFSPTSKKRFSKFRLFGTSQMGFSNYGEDDIYFFRTGYGVASFGVDKFADFILLSGIYRTDNVTGKTRFYREPFYITKNPRTEHQQIHRGIFADAVAGWQALTPAEKAIYNIKSIGKHMSGYNVFLKQYLRSH